MYAPTIDIYFTIGILFAYHGLWFTHPHQVVFDEVFCSETFVMARAHENSRVLAKEAERNRIQTNLAPKRDRTV